MLDRFAIVKLSTAATIVLAVGCQFPWSTGQFSQQNSASPLPSNSYLTSPTRSTNTAEPSELIQTSGVSSEKTHDEAMAEVLGELQEIGAIDQAAQQRLMADLREAKPEHWPLIVKQFQSALAYRQQLAERESQNEPVGSSTAELAKTAPRRSLLSNAANSAAVQTSATKVTETRAPETPAVTPNTSESDAPVKKTSPNTTPLPAKPDESKTSAIAAPTYPEIEQANYVTPLEHPTSRQNHLLSAIAELEQTVNHAPSTTEDVHQHMRLRLLHLLAGQENDALQPVPGTSSTQQDYWSQQLFTLSTFLDHTQQPDDKRRAAASMVHLDRARANLAELATLQVRSLTFVESVDGFGVYQPVAEAKFSPGDQVALYLEVENFRSESTKEGYRTALGTSYEVLDQNGKRVEGAQFPDVEDLCKNQRRDFHMQYGIALPTRIYPGEYRLQLTITDQLSHKIGQTSVPFEIVE